MPRGGKRSENAAKSSKVRKRSQSAVKETEKNPQDEPEAGGPRRSARIRASKFEPRPNKKDKLSAQRSHQLASEKKPSARSRPGAKFVLDLEGDTAPAKPLAKKGKSAAPKSRKDRQVAKGSESKTASNLQREASAGFHEQHDRDLNSKVQSHRTGASRGNAKRPGPVVRKPNRKTAKGKADISDPALEHSSISDPALEYSSILGSGDEYSQRGRRRGSESSKSHQILLQEALERLPLTLDSLGAARYEEPTHTSETSYIDPWEEFNYKYGYLPPLDEETSHIIAAIMDNPALGKKWARISSSEQGLFLVGLSQRNVEINPSKSVDPRNEEIKSVSLGGFLQETAEQKQFCEHLWLRDKASLSQGSNEAIFQRTMMLSLIARHFLIYEKEVNGEQLLDFSAEEPWICLPMPSKALWNTSPGLDLDVKLLTQSKPDLAVSFKREAVINQDLWTSLPTATKALACFENQEPGTSRIFPFLTVEAKNAALAVEDTKALYQSLNNASQALHNFYEFFQDAGPIHRQVFFDKIRFFSVVANSRGVLIRIHRAIEIPQDASPFSLVMPDRPEYRIRFEYREFASLTGTDGFTRSRVVDAFRKIFKYAVDELSVWVTAAAKDILTKLDFEDFQARERVGFYRHGQPSPITSRNTPRTSRATSKSGRASPLAEKLFKANLASNRHSFIHKSTNGRPMPKANNSEPRLSTDSNKRTISQIEIESTDNEESPTIVKRSRKYEANQTS